MTSPFSPLRKHYLSGKEPKKRPRRKKKQNTEAREQKRFVKWARDRGIELNHQNNGANSKQRRIYLHQMGCTAGSADILIFDYLPRAPDARGLALEFKSEGGEQSDAQEDWQKRLDALGWRYHLVRSANEASEVCLWYGL